MMKCVDCDSGDVQYVDNLGIDDELLCEDCAKTRAFNAAYNDRQFESIENISEEDYKRLEKINNGHNV